MSEKMFFAVLAVFVLLVVAGNFRRRRAPESLKYRAKTLLSENEKQWFKVIRDAVPNAHVFGQVALNQLVEPDGRPYTSPYTSALNRISTRSIDFAVLNPELSVLLAIEIDDRTHRQKKRMADDEKKNKALNDAGIALLRFPATPVPTSEFVKKRIVETLAAKNATTEATARMTPPSI